MRVSLPCPPRMTAPGPVAGVTDASSKNLIDVVADPAVELEGDVGLVEAVQLDLVVALAAEADDVVEVALEVLRRVDAERRRREIDAVRRLGDHDLLVAVARVAVQAVDRVRADVELQRAVAQVGAEDRRPVEAQIEAEHLDLGRDRKLVLDLEEPEVDDQVGEQLERQAAVEVEDRQRCEARLVAAQLVVDRIDQLADVNRAVVVGVEEVEADERGALQLDAGARDGDVQLGRHAQVEFEEQLVDVRTLGDVLAVAEEEAVGDQRRVGEPAVGEAPEAVGVEAEAEVDADLEAEPDVGGERAEDRERLRVLEVHQQPRRIERDELHVVPEQQADDLGRIVEEGEGDEVGEVAAAQARKRILGLFAAGVVGRGVGQRVVETAERLRQRAAHRAEVRDQLADRFAAFEQGRLVAHGAGAAHIVEQRQAADLDAEARAAADVVDDVDDVEDGLDPVDEAGVDLAEHARQVEQGDVLLRELAQDRDRRRQHRDDVVERLGELRDLAQRAAEEVVEERAGVEPDVVERNVLETGRQGVAREVLQRCVGRQLPVEDEIRRDVRKRGRDALHAHRKVQVDDVVVQRVALERGREPQAAEVGDAEAVAAAVRVLEVDVEAEVNAAALVGDDQLEEAERAAERIRLRQVDVDVDRELLVAVVEDDVRAVGEVHAHADVDRPADRHLERDVDAHAERRHADVEAEVERHRERVAQREIPLGKALREVAVREVGAAHQTRHVDAPVADAGEEILDQGLDVADLDVGARVDRVAQLGDECVAELLDEAHAVGQIGADERQVDIEQAEVREALQVLEEEIDVVRQHLQVVERVEVRQRARDGRRGRRRRRRDWAG